MAALTLPSTANYEIHESVIVDTADHEDHTFCGIMFPIEAMRDLPVSRLLIHSVSVRGSLGPMTVWVTRKDVDLYSGSDISNRLAHLRSQANLWEKIYERSLAASRRRYAKLDFGENPIVLAPGETRAIYIHSSAPHDRAVVYDNSSPLGNTRYSDSFVRIFSGAAHLSPEPFDHSSLWGFGSGWRDRREFVGQIEFGAVYKLWSPNLHLQFGNNFRGATETLLGCQRRFESPISILPDEVIYYILNMCRWDWFEDSSREMNKHRQRLEQKREKARRRIERTRACAARQSATGLRGSRTRLGFIGKVKEKIFGFL